MVRAMASDEVVKTEALTKIYRDFWGRQKVAALRDLDLTVQRGEILGLLGPNGSGKTTTIKLLLGLLFPTAGQAWVLDKKAEDVSTNDRIGFLPEESYLYRFLNADETLHFYGRLFKMPRRERKRKIDELIDLVGLAHARKRPLREYSKGMSRRIGFAQALINDPDLVFLDEPTAGLDPIGAREMKDLMLDLKKQGKTILLSSHLLADVENVCDRIAMLVNGRLRRLGPVPDLLAIRDELQVRIRSFPPEARAELEKLVEAQGAELLGMTNPSQTLESLFLETTREKDDVQDLGRR